MGGMAMAKSQAATSAPAAAAAPAPAAAAPAAAAPAAGNSNLYDTGGFVEDDYTLGTAI